MPKFLPLISQPSAAACCPPATSQSLSAEQAESVALLLKALLIRCGCG